MEFDAIAQAAQGAYGHSSRSEFMAQPADLYLQCIGSGIGIEGKYRIEQFLFADDLAAVTQQNIQHGTLARREFNFIVIDQSALADGIKMKSSQLAPD